MYRIEKGLNQKKNFMTDNIMKIDIPDAHSLLRTKAQTTENLQIYNTVLQKCIDQIEYTNRTTDKPYTIFSVPLFLLGSYLYNKSTCIMYLINKLEGKNYIARYIDPMYIHIDWGQRVEFDNNSKYIKKILEKHPDAKIEFVYK